MEVAVLTAFATPFMAMLAMLWHQQRSILKKLGEIGERLARIEGYLGIGMFTLEAGPARWYLYDADADAVVESRARSSRASAPGPTPPSAAPRPEPPSSRFAIRFDAIFVTPT